MNGETLNRVNARTGYRNRRFGCGNEFHLLPRCPGKPPSAVRRVSFAMDQPEEVGRDVSGDEVCTTSAILGLLSSNSVSDSAAITDTGASANLVGVKLLNNRNTFRRSVGRPTTNLTAASASFRYGDGRVGDVHCPAFIPTAIMGFTGQF